MVGGTAAGGGTVGGTAAGDGTVGDAVTGGAGLGGAAAGDGCPDPQAWPPPAWAAAWGHGAGVTLRALGSVRCAPPC